MAPNSESAFRFLPTTLATSYLALNSSSVNIGQSLSNAGGLPLAHRD